MNEKFHELSEEKKLRIINAAMEVFSRNEYKRASTDDIAAIAGISKGSLFYYFQNKKSLYLYVYEYTNDLMKSCILDHHFDDITDFFELMDYGAKIKLQILDKNPFIMDFVMRAFYSKGEPVSEDLDSFNQEQMDHLFVNYFQNVDFSKFRDGTDPMYVIRMLTWMTDGYMHEYQRRGLPLKPEDVMNEYRKWAMMLKKFLYKEAYQDERN